MTEEASLEPLLIRPSAEADIAALHQIYAYHVLHGLGSVETEPPSQEEMVRRRHAVLAGGFPHLVAERGTIRSAGYKFGRWVDTVLMQRSLGPGDIALPP